MTALALIHRESILQQMASGKILREIAQELGITKQAISQVLQNDPDYVQAKRYQVEAMIEEAKQETWAAREPLDIARAREMTKFAFRYAESMDSATWAPRSQVTVEHLGDRSDDLRAAKARLIEGEVIVDNSGQTGDNSA